jgi:hypothetical protein
MVWLIVGVVLGGAYGFLWALMFVAGDADERSMREWDRQQAEWRGDFE